MYRFDSGMDDRDSSMMMQQLMTAITEGRLCFLQAFY